jgi:hypothetical protein
LARHLISRWEGELSDEFIRLLLRSAGTDMSEPDQFRHIIQHQLLTFVRELTGDAPDARRRPAMVSTQMLGLSYCRYILELPAVVEIDPDTLAQTLAPVLQHYLTGDLAAPVIPTN